MEEGKKVSWLWLFGINFVISAFTFGGGYVVTVSYTHLLRLHRLLQTMAARLLLRTAAQKQTAPR